MRAKITISAPESAERDNALVCITPILKVEACTKTEESIELEGTIDGENAEDALSVALSAAKEALVGTGKVKAKKLADSVEDETSPLVPAPVEEAPPAPVDPGPVEEVPPPTPVYTLPFTARFEGPSPAALVEQGQAFCAAASGLVAYTEPPTGWDGDAWCVHGLCEDTNAVEAAAVACGGTTRPRAVSAGVAVASSSPSPSTSGGKKKK